MEISNSLNRQWTAPAAISDPSHALMILLTKIIN